MLSLGCGCFDSSPPGRVRCHFRNKNAKTRLLRRIIRVHKATAPFASKLRQKIADVSTNLPWRLKQPLGVEQKGNGGLPWALPCRMEVRISPPGSIEDGYHHALETLWICQPVEGAAVARVYRQANAVGLGRVRHLKPVRAQARRERVGRALQVPTSAADQARKRLFLGPCQHMFNQGFRCNRKNSFPALSGKLNRHLPSISAGSNVRCSVQIPSTKLVRDCSR
jgi:hypothetical protein